MAGKRQENIGTYVTRCRNYRVGISTVDFVVDVEAPTVPELDTRDVPVNPTSTDRNIYGKDARIFFSVLLSSGISAATVQVWMSAEVEAVGNEQTSSSSSISPSEGWVWVQTTDITTSSLVKVLDVPPGRYKALVTSLTGDGTVNILVQYAG